jgi:hypothetical protein
MITLDEFRTGQLSVPGMDADDVPACCFSCLYLSHKEFSTGADDAFYYFCAYSWPDRISTTAPPCLGGSKTHGS